MQVLKEEIRSSILENATLLFMEEGFRRGSMRDISRLCGVSLGNLYHYFASKEEILLGIVSPCMDELEALLGANCLEDVPSLSSALCGFLYTYRTPLHILLLESEGSKVESFAKTLPERLSQWALGQKEGILSRHPALEGRLLDLGLRLAAMDIYGLILEITRGDIAREEALCLIERRLSFDRERCISL